MFRTGVAVQLFRLAEFPKSQWAAELKEWRRSPQFVLRAFAQSFKGLGRQQDLKVFQNFTVVIMEDSTAATSAKE